MNDNRFDPGVTVQYDANLARAQWATQTHAVPELGYTVTTVTAIPDTTTLGDKYAELLREHVRVVDVLQAAVLRLELAERTVKEHGTVLEYVLKVLERMERKQARP